MKAFLKNYKQSPRKVRLVANMIRGKSVGRARAVLAFSEQKSAEALKKLIESAAANARQAGVSNSDELIVGHLLVDEGLTMHRMTPMARGRANPIRKRTSKIRLELSRPVGEVPSKKTSRNTPKKVATVKRVVPKTKSRNTKGENSK
jgi:large subunit ribosomal protein L22